MNKEISISNREKKEVMEILLSFLIACPQIIKPRTGLEEFVEILNKSATKLAENTHEDRQCQDKEPDENTNNSTNLENWL